MSEDAAKVQGFARVIAAAHAVVAAHYNGALTDGLVAELDMAASTLEVIVAES
jgi:hypothetical protein